MQNLQRIMVLDFETRWDSKDYTLKKMTTEEYIRDERFRAWGAGYKFLGDKDTHWVRGEDLSEFFSKIQWDTTGLMCHNTMFDGTILAWIYGHVPAFYFDTLSVARAKRGVDGGNSLDALATSFGLPPKGKALHSTDGLTSLPPEVERELADYCMHDVKLCQAVASKLGLFSLPGSELELIDMTLRMYTTPHLRLDKGMLSGVLDTIESKRVAVLSKLQVNAEDLSSPDKFAEALRAVGVEPPMKPSPTNPRKKIYAFAKSDALFQALADSDNENVAALCEARLMVKSTQVRTRAQRFLQIAERGVLPVPLAYYGAHTGRWAAMRGEAVNLQNLKRNSPLRDAIVAPDGYILVVVDLAQIEPRVLAWYAGYETLLDIFRSGVDAYSSFGATMFGIPGMTKESHPVLRQSAKSAMLGCGYGMGWWSFSAQLLTGFLGAPPVLYDKEFCRSVGVTVRDLEEFISNEDLLEKALSIPRTCTNAEIIVHCLATRALVDKYRKEAHKIQQFWKFLDNMIHECIVNGYQNNFKGLEFKGGEIVLPNGMSLRYPDIDTEPRSYGRDEVVYGKFRKKLYGGSLAENITQAVARIVMTDGMRRIHKRYPVVLTVHDEVAALVPIEEKDEAQIWCREQMVKEPEFMPGLPLAADVGAGVRYGEAK